MEIDLDRVRQLVELHQRGLDAEGGGSSQDGWESDDAYGRVGTGLKGAISDLIDEVAYLRVPPLKRPVTLPSGLPIRSDLERAYERIKELEAANLKLTEERENALDMWERAEEERRLTVEGAKTTQLRLTEALRREAATTAAAKEILARIENLIAST